jgi:cyclohexa-1,5-dienecarbonyl-CoA hydratase
MSIDPVARLLTDDDAIWHVTFGVPPGNILDTPVVQGLTEIFRETAAAPELRAICLEGRGGEFSYGSSIQEHLPEQVPEMLRRFGELIAALIDSSVFVVAAVRGRCLGGGLELASLCHRVIASPDATFGQPEIKLGVFAPVASVVLADRVGRGHAEDLCLSGRTIRADHALEMGLIDQIATGDPMPAALAYVREHLLPLSASSLRFAVRAGRANLAARLTALPGVEQLYLRELMQTHDAVEGVNAFLEKRTPVWKNR